jgi:alpha-L-arabinofuranosidase
VKSKQLTVTVTNSSLNQPRETEIAIRGGTAASAKAVTLAASNAYAHNSFTAPRAVEPREAAVSLRGPALVHRFPPASVTKLEIVLV